MLTSFPDLLTYGFFAPTLLRLAAGLVLLYVAREQYRHRDKIAMLNFPIVGRASWVPTLAATFHAVVGVMLFLGWYTQIAAALAVLGLLKGLWLNRRYPSVVILPNSSILLLIVICLSLLLTGAGAIAKDLPL